jgi:hypothetical protein
VPQFSQVSDVGPALFRASWALLLARDRPVWGD